MARNAPNKDELFKMAVDAIKNGQKQPARMMLQQILQLDNRDVRAMSLMARVAASREERAEWLKRILKINPKDAAAKKALRKLETRDEAKRNRFLLRVGSVIYVLVVFIISIILIITSL